MANETLPRSVSRSSEWTSVASLLAAAHELALCGERDQLLRQGVEFARERIGLERVGLYTCEASARGVLMRGSWGTGLHGETLDERGYCHECSAADRETLLRLQRSGALWIYRERVPYVVERAIVGYGWLVVTPLVSGRELVGVMYNDAAVTQSVVDHDRQVAAAVLCSVLAGVLALRRTDSSWSAGRREPHPSTLVQEVLRALRHDPILTGAHLARELGVSPGYLARSFKSEVGVSLVEYRNRIRLERFLGSVERGDTNFLRAALEAGFGSYAQFHRVYRKLLGATPRRHLLPARKLGRNEKQSRFVKTPGS
jgi:AraC-like DNA-binding protein